MKSYPTFHNEVGVPIVRIGCREFKCIGDKPPQDHRHIYLKMGDASEIVCPYCSTLFRFDPSLGAHEATRQIVLTVIRTELNCSNAASFVVPAAANQRQTPSSRSFGAVRTIQIRQDASVTTAEPAIAVARDQVIDRIADHPWDELEDPMSTASAEARAQCAARPRILNRPGRSPRNPGDQV